ncbi:hypothetical protein BS78_09G126900 [Paspalum vaginatum]|nr:hypothetical protein BS78_09G126900 [Paspalum vaginatum]
MSELTHEWIGLIPASHPIHAFPREGTVELGLQSASPTRSEKRGCSNRNPIEEKEEERAPKKTEMGRMATSEGQHRWKDGTRGSREDVVDAKVGRRVGDEETNLAAGAAEKRWRRGAARGSQ